MQTERLQLIDIEAGDRLRAVDPAQVSTLKASICEIGLMTPVTVSAIRDGDDWRFRLVAGAHRLEALRQLGHDAVDCYVMEGDEDDAALWEIDENLTRAELTPAQRADHHARREEILVRKGLVRSGPGQPKKNSDKLSSYSAQAAEALGVDERTVQRELARGKKIAPDVLSEVAGTDMDKGAVLDELASTPVAEQRAKLAEITLRRQEAEQTRRAAEAVNRDTDRAIALTDAQQFAEWLMARCGLGEIATLISWLEGTKAKDVISALRREAA